MGRICSLSDNFRPYAKLFIENIWNLENNVVYLRCSYGTKAIIDKNGYEHSLQFD